MVFLINNESDIYVWFGTSKNQEDEFQSIPPFFMAFVVPEHGKI